MTDNPIEATDATWHKTACILCECNCGVEVKLDGRRFTRVRGNKNHVASKGYTCEKALRLDHYQNATDRLTSPMRRRPDGSYEPIDWDTAIKEVAEGLAAVRDAYGGDKILYYGGGGQGNHLGGAFSGALWGALGGRMRSNAIAQEKQGEIFADSRLTRAKTRGDFEHTEVSVFVGKNPWQSHGFPEARRVLKEIAKDEKRSMVVIDPRRTETADLADYFLQVRPGTDAFCLSAIIATMVQEGLVDQLFLDTRTTGSDTVTAAFADISVSDYSERCGVDEDLIRQTARRIATAGSVAVFEDLGIEMAPDSTLVSYLEKLLWILAGSYGRPGAMHVVTSFAALARAGGGNARTMPVTGGRIIGGLAPANLLAEETLTDHPDRIRAMFIESANPAHSLADSPRFKAAMEAVEFSVVIDVAMTETARHAHYVLPAATQFEKAEAVFFNFEFPDNVFYLRAPILPPLHGTLPEPEIHSRLAHELGLLSDEVLDPLRDAARKGRGEFRDAFLQAAVDPTLRRLGAIVLYETLGPTLPEGLAASAALWFLAHQCAERHPDAVRRAGHAGEGPELGEALFDAIVEGRDGVVFTSHDFADAWDLIGHDDHKIHTDIPEMLGMLAALVDRPATYTSPEYPFVLAAGERRSFTANTILRDPAWRKRDAVGALRICPDDAADLGIDNGGSVRIVTRRGEAIATIETTDTLQRGHVTLPNGLGVDYDADGTGATPTGVSPNDLTSDDWRDEFAATPWHKHVPARLELPIES